MSSLPATGRPATTAPFHTVRGEALVHAPLERLWKLSTRVELVRKTLGMQLVGGVTSGFIGAGSRVIWRGWKFGLPTRHHTLITGFQPPHPASAEPQTEATEHAEAPGQPKAWFQDSQERGRFAFFQHNHWLRQRTGEGGEPLTVLEDEVHFRLPLGFLGRWAARAVMAGYIRRLVHRRFAMLAELAESEAWRDWV